jgi:hypothetical protein
VVPFLPPPVMELGNAAAPGWGIAQRHPELIPLLHDEPPSLPLADTGRFFILA